MTLIVLVVLAILAIVTVPFIFAAIIGSDLAGANADLSVLGEDELLTPSQDRKQSAMIQDKKQEIDDLVSSANLYYNNRSNPKATSSTLLQTISDNLSYRNRPAPKDASEALLQAVQCYEDIREEANSAVVELNLAILTKARLKVEKELRDDTELIEGLEKYLAEVLYCADQLLEKKPSRYANEVKRLYKKL